MQLMQLRGGGRRKCPPETRTRSGGWGAAAISEVRKDKQQRGIPKKGSPND